MNGTALPRRSVWRQLFWRSLTSSAVIGLLVWLVPLDEIKRALDGVDPWLAAASLAMVLPMAATKAAIFWLAAAVQGLVFSFRRMLEIQLASAFYTLVMPGQLGGTVSRWYMMQRPGRQPVEAAAVMLMARYLETTLACVIGLALALADPQARQGLVIPIAFAVIVATALLLPLLLAGRVGRRFAQGIVAGLPRHRWLMPLHHALPKLRDAAARIRSMRLAVAWRVLALSLLWNVLGIASIALAAAAVGAEVSWITLAWMRSLLALILVLPLAWGGIGLREAGVAAVLQPYGVPAALAIGIGAIVSLRNILEAVIGGFVEIIGLWRRRRRRRPVAPAPGEPLPVPSLASPLDGTGPAR